MSGKRRSRLSIGEIRRRFSLGRDTDGASDYQASV